MRRGYSPQSPPRASGFTLLELIFVCAVIAILASMTLAGSLTLRASLRKSGTKSLVNMVVTAMISYHQSTLPIPISGSSEVKHLRLWDWNKDGIIDGFPDQETLGDLSQRSEVIAKGYRGFAAMTGISLAKRNLDQQTGKILDAWGQPLHLDFAVNRYGDSAFGVWSAGPDGLDGGSGSPAAMDNICSWK